MIHKSSPKVSGQDGGDGYFYGQQNSNSRSGAGVIPEQEELNIYGDEIDEDDHSGANAFSAQKSPGYQAENLTINRDINHIHKQSKDSFDLKSRVKTLNQDKLK